MPPPRILRWRRQKTSMYNYVRWAFCCLANVSVCNFGQLGQPFIPPGSVNDDQLRLGGKGMVHSVSAWKRGVQIKLWDPLRTCAIIEGLRGVFTMRHYTNPRFPYLILPESDTAAKSWSRSEQCLTIVWHFICHSACSVVCEGRRHSDRKQAAHGLWSSAASSGGIVRGHCPSKKVETQTAVNRLYY